MPDRLLGMTILVGLFSWAVIHHAQADPLSENHPIFEKPKVLQRIGSVGYAERAYQGGPPALLEWRVALDKVKYVVGEPISGVLTVTNPESNNRDTTAIHYRLSPPYNGLYVSTLSIWRSRQLEGDEWSPLEQSVEPNRGAYHPRVGMQGKPVLLRAGESLKFPLLLNTAVDHTGKWTSGVGFDEPGRYRVTVRYHNLEPIRPFAPRHGGPAGGQGKRQREARPDSAKKESILEAGQYADKAAMLIGPVEVEIVAAPEELHEPLAAFTKGVGRPSLERLRVHPSLKEPELAALRQAVELAWLRTPPRDFYTQSNAERHPWRREVADSADALSKEVEPGGIREAVVLTHCLVLKELGEEEKALGRAKKEIEKSELELPDVQVFMEELRHEQPQRKAEPSQEPTGAAPPNSELQLSLHEFKDSSRAEYTIGRPVELDFAARGTIEQQARVRTLQPYSGLTSPRTIALFIRKPGRTEFEPFDLGAPPGVTDETETGPVVGNKLESR